MTWDQWKAAAQLHAERVGLPPGLWADDDPYDLAEAAASAFTDGRDPESFINDAFDEELARMEGDAQNFADSMQAALDEGNEPPTCPICHGSPCCLDGTPNGPFVSGAHVRIITGDSR